MNKHLMTRIALTLAFIFLICWLSNFYAYIPLPAGSASIRLDIFFHLLGGLALGPVWGVAASFVGGCIYNILFLGLTQALLPINFLPGVLLALVAGLVIGRGKASPVRRLASVVCSGLLYAATQIGITWMMLRMYQDVPDPNSYLKERVIYLLALLLLCLMVTFPLSLLLDKLLGAGRLRPKADKGEQDA